MQGCPFMHTHTHAESEEDEYNYHSWSSRKKTFGHSHPLYCLQNVGNSSVLLLSVSFHL